MKTLQWKNLVGQDRIKRILSGAVAGETIGQAYLFCGDPGTGTFQAALELSMALLCGVGGDVPCHECESCRKVLRYSHPDFRVIMPVTLEREHKDSEGRLNQDGWEFLSSLIRTRIERPYSLPRQPGVPSIPVEWVKEVNHAINRGSVAGGKNVAVIDTVDAMNKESANAMLATLEEPPENTVMLLLTSRPQAVLPTIASRCQLLRFGLLPASDIRRALVSRYAPSAGAATLDEAVDYSLGSLGRAVELCENPLGELGRESRSLFEECLRGDWPAIASRVDDLVRRGEDEGIERLLMHLVYLFRSEMLRGVSDGGGGGLIAGVAETGFGALSPDRPEYAWKLFRACQRAIDGVRAHGNMGIVLVNFVTTCMEIIREQKQQIGRSRF
jgi:hypothetical protein